LFHVLRGKQNTNCPGYFPPPSPPWLIPVLIVAAMLVFTAIGGFILRKRKTKVQDTEAIPMDNLENQK
jgi:hypothetical protein